MHILNKRVLLYSIQYRGRKFYFEAVKLALSEISTAWPRFRGLERRLKSISFSKHIIAIQPETLKYT